MAARPSRKQREKQQELEQRRRELLEVALDLFSRKGFEQTTVAEIAEQAEFAVGTLYTLFEDKNAIYSCLIREAVVEFEQALCAALESPGTEVQKIERYIETMAALFVKHAALARIYFGQISMPFFAPLARLDRETRAIRERFLALLESVFRAGMRNRLFLKMDPRLLALGLEGLSNAFLLESINNPDGLSADAMAQVVKKILFDQVRLDASAR